MPAAGQPRADLERSESQWVKDVGGTSVSFCSQLHAEEGFPWLLRRPHTSSRSVREGVCASSEAVCGLRLPFLPRRSSLARMAATSSWSLVEGKGSRAV